MVNIDFTFESGVSINQALSFEMAGKIWSQFLTDDISIDITVAATDQLPDEVLGGSVVSRQTVDLGVVEAALQADVSSNNDAIAINTMGQDGIFQGTVNGTLYQGDSIQMSQAQLKALGIATPDFVEADGFIVFNSLNNSEVQWDYGLDRSTPASPGSVDHLSIALHEIGHVLGFISGLDVTTGDPLETSTLLDLYRYSTQSALAGSNELTPGVSTFFSVDGGVTSLAPFSSGISVVDTLTQQGYQASHWGDPSAATEVLIEESGLNSSLDGLFALFDSTFPNTVLTTPGNVVLTAASQAREITDYLIAQSLTSLLVAEDNGVNLGILDPTLAIEERSNITTLDLTAFDVLGYDLNSTVNAAEIDYANILDQAKQTVSELSGLTPEELQLGLDRNLIIRENDQDASAIQFDPDEIYERRRRRRRVTSSASFWQELDQDRYVQTYGSEDLNLLPFRYYVEGDADGLLNSIGAEAESNTPYTVITGNDSNVIEGWQGQVSVKTGLGNDLIALGNKDRAYMAEAGDQDFLTVQDWNDRDFLLLHGDRSQYTQREDSLYYRDDLIAKFKGGISFDLESNHVFYSKDLLGEPNEFTPTNKNEFLFPVQDLFGVFDTNFSSTEITSMEIFRNQLEFFELFIGNPLETPLNPTNSGLEETRTQSTLNGGMGKDIILGSQSHELIRGRKGDDVLVGNSGNDTLFGQNGDDLLNGTDSMTQGISERDILMGGKGADIFILGDERGAYYAQNKRQDQAIIKDFSITEDRLQLHGRADSYQFRTINNNTGVVFEGDRIALIQGVQNFPSTPDIVQFV